MSISAIPRGRRAVPVGGNAYSVRSTSRLATTTPRAAPHMSRVET